MNLSGSLSRAAEGKMANLKEMDMTKGPLTKQLIVFSIPIILTGVIQLLFNTADHIVVGKFASDRSLAAVGSTGSLTTLFVNLFIGISSGVSAVIARFYGAHDDRRVSATVHTSILMSLVFGVLLSVAGWFLSGPMLALMGSPEDTIELSTLYMRIYFLGMPFNMLYNFGAAVLRAVGDSQRPLRFITLGGAVNVVLNLILVIVFRLDVAGVAIATVVSQIISSLLVLISLIKADGCCHLELKSLRLHKKEFAEVLKIGVPAGIQSSLFAVSNVLIQSSVNSFGSTVMAGHSAASSIEGFVYTSMNALHHTCMNFASQNYGAGDLRRMKQSVRNCVLIAAVLGVALGLLSWAFAAPLLSIFTDTGDPIPYGVVKITVFGFTYWMCGVMESLAGFLRGIGRSVAPMVNSIFFACFMRMVWIWTVLDPLRPSLDVPDALRVLYLSYPISWLLVTISHFLFYRIFVAKKLESEVCAK